MRIAFDVSNHTFMLEHIHRSSSRTWVVGAVFQF